MSGVREYGWTLVVGPHHGGHQASAWKAKLYRVSAGGMIKMAFIIRMYQKLYIKEACIYIPVTPNLIFLPRLIPECFWASRAQGHKGFL